MDRPVLGQVRPRTVQQGGRGDHLVDARLVQRALLDRGGIDADAQALCQDQRVAHLRIGVPAQLRRVHQPDDCKTVDRLGRVDGMAARDRDARLGADGAAAFEDLADGFHRQLVDGHPQDRQRHDRPPAHGIDVGNGVGRGDAAKGAGVVHHGHEEVRGRDHGRLLVDLPDGGIVGRLGAHQKLREHLSHRLAGQKVAQHGGGQLAAAAAAMGQLGQAKGNIGHGPGSWDGMTLP